MTTATDVDNNLSTVTEYDALGRPVKVRSAANTLLESWVQTSYDDVNRRVIVKSDIDTVGDARKVATQFYDQLGRVRLAKTLEDAATQSATNETDGIKVQTRYKTVSGYTYQLTSNPYRAATSGAETDATMGWTLSTTWSNGRRSEVQTFSGAALPTAFGGNNTDSTGIVRTDIDTNYTTVTDQAGKQRRSITNALGQLMRVDEPDASGALGSVTAPNQPTYYSYNTLGKMVRVQQGVQNRWFMYDSLGRMLRVRQPEQEVNIGLNTNGNPDNNSWSAGFTYDNNGNVLTATDAKGTTITNTYDALNRPLTRVYSNEPQGVSTPAVTNYYDGLGLPSVPQFSKGKLTKVSSSISESRYTEFDQLGRLKQYQQLTDGNTYTSSYQYNLSGALTQETYPSGRVVQNEFETDGDLAKVTSQKAGGSVYAPYASNMSYSAAGAVTSMRLGNGKWETASFNSRLQPVHLGLGASVADTGLWKVNYEYGELQTNGTVDALKNNGNIAKQTLTVPGTNFVQAYKYDPLNRLTEAKETTGTIQNWIQGWTYDLYGNRSAFTQNIAGNTAVTNPTVDANTNRFVIGQGFVYDKNGNVVNDVDAATGHSRQFVFNGDNKQTQVNDLSANQTKGTYFYDGEGKRVKKVTETETTVFVYSAEKLVAEYSTQLSATPSINYTTIDHLGSPRTITDQLGQVKFRRDFMPFGEDIFLNVGSRTAALKYGSTQDDVKQKFTGYLKDTETSLDFAEARMYENRFGRFTAVDPLLASGDPEAPQSFNRYTYTMNRPLILTDWSGLSPTDFVDENGTRSRIDDGKDQVIATQSQNVARLNQTFNTNRAEYNVLLGALEVTPANLNLTSNEFTARVATTYGESSAFRMSAGEELGNEMKAIAYVNQRNNKAYGADNEQALDYQNTRMSKETDQMKLANLAVVNQVQGGHDPSNGATMWDGGEQGMFSAADTRASNGKFEIHMNVMGWNISKDHYDKWKANVGPAFKAPQVRISPRNYPAKGYYNKDKTRLHSTAVYGRTIFWRETP